METLIINVPQNKGTLVKQLLKKLSVTILNETKAMLLAEQINNSIKPGTTPDMDEIVAEVKETRSRQLLS